MSKTAKSQEAVATDPVEPAQAETTAQAEAVQLQLSDLQGLAQIIDVASRRGAFKAAELADVGVLYNKLNAFLAYAAAAQAEASQQSEQVTSEDDSNPSASE